MTKDSKAKADTRLADEDIPEPAHGGDWFGDLVADEENWFGTVSPAEQPEPQGLAVKSKT